MTNVECLNQSEWHESGGYCSNCPLKNNLKPDGTIKRKIANRLSNEGKITLRESLSDMWTDLAECPGTRIAKIS